MRCKSCGRFFKPDPRTGGWQKTCARSVCKKKNKKRQVLAWRARSHQHLLRGRQVPYERQYRRDNRLELAAKMLTRYRRDPRVYQARVRAWKKKNRQAMTWYMRQRRHLLKILPGISPEQFKTLRKKAAQL